MTWNNTSPALVNSIAADIADITENFQHSHNAAGSVDLLVGTCTINSHGILEVDATAGRVLRMSRLYIENGTNANTLKCTLVNIFNGDAIAETDNIAKGATTGNFTLDAAGEVLKVEAAGLSGNVVGAMGVMSYNTTASNVLPRTSVVANDISVELRLINTGAAQDMPALVDSSGGTETYVDFLYITNA